MIYILKYWKIFAFIGLLLGAVTVGYKYATGEAAKDKVTALAKMKKTTETKQRKANETNQKQLNDLQSINGNLITDIKRLQHRASRNITKRNTSACKGSTGANLSREDSQFLTGEAARADTLRTALGACYEYIDTVTAVDD